jgi:hypothetical protein
VAVKRNKKAGMGNHEGFEPGKPFATRDTKATKYGG